MQLSKGFRSKVKKIVGRGGKGKGAKWQKDRKTYRQAKDRLSDIT